MFLLILEAIQLSRVIVAVEVLMGGAAAGLVAFYGCKKIIAAFKG